MKKLILVLILLSFSCKSKQLPQEILDPKLEFGFIVNAQISKIDSIQNYYLVYIENDNEFYKIVSNKNAAIFNDGIKVINGESYNFRIEQLTDRKNATANNEFAPINYLDIAQCRKFRQTKICTETSFELAKANNLSGLYIRKVK
jgi:hypothetical protein